MNRRAFLKRGVSLFAASTALSSATSHALITCSPSNYQGFQACESGISSNIANIVAASAGPQDMTQWCWAACIEMVFRYYGYKVSQQEIVRQAWGDIFNMPGRPQDIMASLNRQWRDANGREFTVSGDTDSANPVTAAQDLSDDMPLIIGTMGHAMVLTSLQYTRQQYGPFNVNAAIVRDPWPDRGRRILNAQEWYNTSLLIRIRVRGA